MQNKPEPTSLESNSHLTSSGLCPLSSAHLVLSTADVRWKLVAILAAVATDVTLERLSEAMTTHVDGEHDVVQKEDAAVPAVEGAHRPALPV